MLFDRALTAASLTVGLGSAQLVIRPSHMEQAGSYKPTLWSPSLPSDQRPLVNSDSYTASSTADGRPYKAGSHTVRPQDNTTCATVGESQWTGTVDVTDERRLFFWFFDSRNDPAADPVVIWLNGGPGGSSMMGLFNEMGPCWLEPDAKVTSPNEYAWNKNASLLFIDQPAGVGFSTVAEGAPLPAGDLDGAQDFQVFLNVFFGDIFPDRARLPIHVAAESYGGHYAPTYLKHILDSRAFDSRSAFWGNITSLVLIDAVVDFVAPSIGAYELLCSGFRGGSRDIVTEQACEGIRLALPECERLGRSCDLSYDGHECYAMYRFCQLSIDGYYALEVEKGKRNPYNSE